MADLLKLRPLTEYSMSLATGSNVFRPPVANAPQLFFYENIRPAERFIALR
jgi:hypothetical protein